MRLVLLCFANLLKPTSKCSTVNSRWMRSGRRASYDSEASASPTSSPRRIGAVGTATAGSVIIALAVLANHIDGATAFALSQLDESYQIERWGLDDDAKQRREGIYATIENAAKFVQILRD